ncbi:hypothetical protein ELH33_32965 (plasmid) [Rhizobium ruizarguesonis]|uniref:hypothetical protein n=1 Tax=Rhizobium ruizarguesonis TaxID=2081791 RepID=UPI0010320E27|nr:hypothetical protein [Rhizobium ruizarguesonis]TBC25591.1 hypothetical protein ELH33_32965 [Rhizobium ruizarguesonis]
MTILGIVLATVSAVVAAYLDGTKSSESGRLTKKGVFIVIVAFCGLALAATGQGVSYYNKQRADQESQKQNDKMVRLIARQSLPLQPI